ncbi:hypothetical protein Cni_G06958 [Canna indica]|uniref:Origin recognition complex subunit 1 n=1 Tax=Canna indica TaxID=4628 RepID=A0AAQ3JZI4_9LILI|nr:hypothetical protein Cni_G06958 [Canna indica]
MESTPTPSRSNLSTSVPPTPKSAALRRSLRLTSSASRSPAPATTVAVDNLDTPRSTRKTKRSLAMTTNTKRIPKHARFHKQTDMENAKAMLLLATLPKSLPCRTREMEEITAFVKGAISDDNCLGRCLYIHGVPGTGKTMCVLSAMRNSKFEVDAGVPLRPYTFVEINGLKVASPENIYKVIYEALSGHRVGWKKALHLLNERFSNGSGVHKDERRPCVLLIDELDLLFTRNQSVLYNIFHWPTEPHSKLIIIGIANTMDLSEKLLPRISSRMGIQRLCFGPYTYQQLQEIISSRLKGLDAFEEQAIEFASRKVAAMSGDARRALEICRRAAEIVDYQLKQSLLSGRSSSSIDNSFGGKQLVGMIDIEDAIHEVFQAPHIQMMKTSSKLEKIFLVAMVHQLYRSGLSETTFEKIVDRPTHGHLFPSREYVQAQWVYDCINARIILPTEGYLVGRVPPAHLSPFVDNEAE